MNTMWIVLCGILLVYLGIIIGEVKSSIVFNRERKKDEEDLDVMRKIVANMTLKINEMIGDGKDNDSENPQ